MRGLATHSEEVSTLALRRDLFLHVPFQLKKTVLYDFHVENGAKMVPFGGYAMPLAYEGLDQG